MRAVVQRVSSASVSIDGEVVSRIGAGLVVLAAVGRHDTDADADYIVDKTVHLRVFPDAEGRFDRSVEDVGGSLLVVSQFTLYGDVRRGRRPSFTEAAPPDEASARFADVVERFRATGVPVETGQFQAMMDVALVNDGPVTLILDSADRHRPRR
ncbi:MAG: D-tyrosyl-tRNA(Tyr) deacylase [Chloroflexi bacterium]|nr:D-tyrosyl-tRNA(Tyr) deacylase [Chloroflexota bacterium]MYK34428.1 D-tyrosyl-tRNA(Tyr) deacylase [Chloroflexota bacterium]